MSNENTNILKNLTECKLKFSIKKFIDTLNFEFMDLKKVPSSLRSVLREILEVGNGAPFRGYYQWVSTSVYEYAQKNKLEQIVELGAGCAPITRHLIHKYPSWNAKFFVTDLNPDLSIFKYLEQCDSRVHAFSDSIDFSKKIEGFENSLLILSATFHHIDEREKIYILNNLKSISPHVMVFEPLRPTLTSFLFVLCALISGFLTPLLRVNSKTFFRCFFWCWVLPIAPFMFLWDGWISACRCWNLKEWQRYFPKSVIKETLFCTRVIINK